VTRIVEANSVFLTQGKLASVSLFCAFAKIARNRFRQPLICVATGAGPP
jgi:hypothetical protein